MLYFHKELKEKLKSDYQIQKSVSNKEYFKIESGLYSDMEFVKPLEIICKKYPNAIFTSDNAYYYNLTDARNNWLGVPVNEVINSIIIYFEKLETVQV